VQGVDDDAGAAQSEAGLLQPAAQFAQQAGRPASGQRLGDDPVRQRGELLRQASVLPCGRR